MAKPKFVKDANELQFSRGMQYPVSKPVEKIQATDRTASGALQVESLGLNIETRRLVFKNLPQTDYDDLVDWFNNIADGAANTFEYYDETGASMTVRIISKKLDFPQTYHEQYSGELLLEVVD